MNEKKEEKIAPAVIGLHKEGPAIPRCNTCAHWGNNRNYNIDTGERLKSCDHPDHFYGYHFKLNEVPDNGAAIEDDCGWGMLTGPDFGCTNWTAKTNKPQP